MKRIAAVLLAVFVLSPSPVLAADGPQDRPGPMVSGIVAITAAESNTDAGFAGSFGYRLNSVVGMEIEITDIPKFRSVDAPRIGPRAMTMVSGPGVNIPIPVDNFMPRRKGGPAVLLTTNVRIHIPAGVDRVLPYFVAGGGMANIKEKVSIPQVRILTSTQPPQPAGASIAPIPVPTRIGYFTDVTSSRTGLALNIGGGVSFVVVKGFSADVDARYYRILGIRDLNIGRFGIGASYRF